MSVAKRYLRGASFLLAQSVVARAFGILSSIILSRGLTPAAFGVYSVILSTAASGYGLVRLGVDGGLHVHMAEHDHDENRSRKGAILGAGLILLAIAGIVGALATWIGSPRIASEVFGDPSLARWLRFSAVLVLLQCLQVFCYSTLAGLHEFPAYTVVVTAMAALNLVGLAVLVPFAGLPGAIAATLAVSALTVAMLGKGIRRSLRVRRIPLLFTGIRTGAAALLKIGVPFYLAGLVAIPVTYFAQGLLSREVGIESLGYLRIVVTFTGLITFIPTSVAAATISSLTELKSDPSYGDDSFYRLNFLNLRVTWLICLIMALCTFGLLPLVLPALFGHEYAGAVPIAQISVFTSVLIAVANTAANGFFAERRTDLVFGQHVVYAALFLISSLVLVPGLGLVGYAVAELVGWGGVSLMVFTLLHRRSRRHGITLTPVLILTVANAVSFGIAWTTARASFAPGWQIATVLLISVMLVALGYTVLLEKAERAAIIQLTKRTGQYLRQKRGYV